MIVNIIDFRSNPYNTTVSVDYEPAHKYSIIDGATSYINDCGKQGDDGYEIVTNLSLVEAIEHGNLYLEGCWVMFIYDPYTQ